MTATALIRKLNLVQHPEGGYYRETYRGEIKIKFAEKERHTSTAIYYLLEGKDKSHFHKVLSDEIWLFHQGETIEIYVLLPDGKIKTEKLGNNIELGESPQIVIPKGKWFAAKLVSNSGFGLVSCIVAPGFEFDDFLLANKQELLEQYSQHQELIKEMCL